jgi:Flp pilus assembly protein TadG
MTTADRRPWRVPARARALMPRAGRRRADGGSISLEVAILLPGFMTLAMVAMMFGRETIAQSTVDLAAHDAARAASIARDYPDALAAAKAAAGSTLNLAGTPCTGLVVTLTPYDKTKVPPATAWSVPVGLPSAVTVTVTCNVALSDLALLPRLHPKVAITGSFTSPLDTYRSRS